MSNAEERPVKPHRSMSESKTPFDRDPSDMQQRIMEGEAREGALTVSRCPSCGQQMRGTDWVDRILADNHRLETELAAAREENERIQLELSNWDST